MFLDKRVVKTETAYNSFQTVVVSLWSVKGTFRDPLNEI